MTKQVSLFSNTSVFTGHNIHYPLWRVFSLIKTLSHLDGRPKQRENVLKWTRPKSLFMALAVYFHYETVRDIPTLSFQECHLLTACSLLRLTV